VAPLTKTSLVEYLGTAFLSNDVSKQDSFVFSQLPDQYYNKIGQNSHLKELIVFVNVAFMFLR